MKTPQFRTGDRILVNSNSFLSRSIQFFMRLYARKRHIDTQNTFSHAGTLVFIDGELYIAEAVENGYKLREFNKHYNLAKDKIIVFRNGIPYTRDEQTMARKYALYLMEVNNCYQYWAFIQWIVLILFNINIFGKGNKFSSECYEATYRIAKHVRPDEFIRNPETATCYDILLETDKIVFDYRKNDNAENEKTEVRYNRLLL